MLEEVMSEEKYIEIASNILEKVKKKIDSELTETWYQEMQCYLYDQYSNVANNIEDKLIDKIAGSYLKEPESYKFKQIRQKMFEDNKEKLTSIITDDMVKEHLENVFLEYTNEHYYFNWQWLGGIVKTICKNWELFEHNKRINERIVCEIKRKDEIIEWYKNKLKEIQGLSEE
jgi:uncharacterized membrane protein YheB (UPF0754 family)